MSIADWARRKLQPSSRHEGAAAVPFPSVDRDEYIRSTGLSHAELNARIRAAPVQDVPLGRLVAIQHTVQPHVVADYLADPDAESMTEGDPKSPVPRDLPIVVKVGGAYVIHDGHHRAVAALLRGEHTIKARVVDLDEEMAGRK